MRIVSWNVNKRRDCAGQVAALLSMKPDLVVLQEVVPRAWPLLSAELCGGGLAHGVCGWELGEPLDPLRQLASGVAIWSRWRLFPAAPAAVPDGRAVVCVGLDYEAGAFDLIGVHIPSASLADRMLKVETQEGLIARLAEARRPMILCGDLNSPRAEGVDGAVTPFTSPRRARAYAAEAALVGMVNSAGMADVYRVGKGYGADAPSWFWKNRGRTGGFRLDHIYATPSVVVRDCDYVHDWRIRGLSDHSAIYADLGIVAEVTRSDHEASGR